MNYLLLFDVAPDPVSTGIGIAGLAFVAIVVLMITAGMLVAAVFLFIRIRQSSNQGARPMPGDVRLNLESAPSQPASQVDRTQ